MLPVAAPQEKKAGLAYWSDRVLQECDKASQGFAADPVHDLRVAIRRCRSMADGFLSVDPDPDWKRMKRLAKPLFGSLGDLRDMQVMSEWVAKFSEPGDAVRENLLQALAQKENALKEAAQEALASFDRKTWTSLNDHLSHRTTRIPLEGLVFQELALERWAEAHELHRQALRNRSQVGYHQLRIGIKRFRYTVENFLPGRHERWAKDLRTLQDALGEVHDFDVLRAMLRAHAELSVEQRVHWQKRITAERQKRLDLYRKRMVGKASLWLVWRSELPSGPTLEKAAMEKLRVWAAGFDPDPRHSTHVSRLALSLYDGLSQCGILKLRGDDRRILRAGSILHEIGRSKSGNGHQKHSYRMICKMKPPFGWSDEEMRCVAAVARHHRGRIPQLSHSSFVGLSPKRRSEMMPIIGILRLANALDESHDQSISRIVVEQREGVIILSGQGLQEISPNAERIARARYLLETACQLPIMLRPLPDRAAAARKRNAQNYGI
jgi:CHAD domain-containing protein/HD superfamily phosphodiesterase